MGTSMSLTDRKWRGARPAPDRRKTQMERSRATQKRILDAAIRIMARKGTAGVRTGDIAKEAGVSVGAQLHHFPTKRSIVLAAFAHLNERSTETSIQRARFAGRSPDPSSLISAVMADASDFFFGKGFFIELALAFGDANAELYKTVRKFSRRSRFTIEKSWTEVLVERGLPPEIAGDILALTLGVIRGFATRRFIDDDPARREHLKRVWTEMVEAFLFSKLSPEQLEIIYSPNYFAANAAEALEGPLVALVQASPMGVRQRTRTKEQL